MTTHHHQASTSSRGDVNHKSKMASGKDSLGNGKKSLLLNTDNLSSLNTSMFDIPITTSGMKNIEHYIEKTMIDGKQWYRCKWNGCPYTTIRSDSIVRHMRKHTGDRPYKCWFCSYATIQSSALKIHIRRHTGERPYVCKFENCGKRFAVLNTLSVHERTHTGFKPYKCSLSGCNYTSNDRSKLVLHMHKSHGIDLDPTGTGSGGKLNSGHHLGSTLFSMPNGHGGSGGTSSSSHSLALVSGSMSSPSSLLMAANSVYNPFTAGSASGHQMINNGNALKSSGSSSASAFSVPLNLLTVFSGGAANYENLQNDSSVSSIVAKSVNHHQQPSTNKRRKPTQKQLQQHHQAGNNIFINQHHNTNQQGGNISGSSHKKRSASSQSSSAALAISNATAAALSTDVGLEENSIKRVMAMVDKRIVHNRTSYACKWPSCSYESLRSDSIVRHIRSHTGEKPYRCGQCSYATIQRCTLTKHLIKHQNEYISATVGGGVVNNYC